MNCSYYVPTFYKEASSVSWFIRDQAMYIPFHILAPLKTLSRVLLSLHAALIIAAWFETQEHLYICVMEFSGVSGQG